MFGKQGIYRWPGLLVSLTAGSHRRSDRNGYRNTASWSWSWRASKDYY
jgi:hypothetical protein